MNTECVEPFIEGVYSLFAKLLNINVKQGEIRVTRSDTNDDLVALVGLTVPARGTVSLSFPTKTAMAIISHLVEGQSGEIDDEMTADGLGELVNIVAGNGKEKLSPPDLPPVELSLPTVIRGRKQIINGAAQAVWLMVVFKTDMGPFSLGVTFNDESGMTVDRITPFIQAVHECFGTMMATTVQCGSVMVAERCGSDEDLIALVGLGGPVRGSVLLAFPVDTALAVVGRFAGTTFEDIDDDVIDGLAEIANIVAGTAKKDLVGQDDSPFELTLPSVLSGKTQRLEHPRSAWLEVSFDSDLGPFDLRVNLDYATTDSESV